MYFFLLTPLKVESDIIFGLKSNIFQYTMVQYATFSRQVKNVIKKNFQQGVPSETHSRLNHLRSFTKGNLVKYVYCLRSQDFPTGTMQP